MRELPLASHDLAEFLRLVGYDELCKEEVADAMLPDFIAHLQRFVSKSTDQLLEILDSLKAREWPPIPPLPLRPVLTARDFLNKPRCSPVFRVPSFHDPPGRKR